jgi:hypothetical protein
MKKHAARNSQASFPPSTGGSENSCLALPFSSCRSGWSSLDCDSEAVSNSNVDSAISRSVTAPANVTDGWWTFRALNVRCSPGAGDAGLRGPNPDVIHPQHGSSKGDALKMTAGRMKALGLGVLGLHRRYHWLAVMLAAPLGSSTVDRLANQQSRRYWRYVKMQDFPPGS